MFSLEMFRSELKNSKIKATQRSYSSEMKEFALTLYFYSPRACECLRKNMFASCWDVVGFLLSTMKKGFCKKFLTFYKDRQKRGLLW